MTKNLADGAAVSLTRRQEEIASLVAEGLSNREIGEKLFISERTVDGHLEELRSKLGMSSRAAISAWVVKRRLGSAQVSHVLREGAAAVSEGSRRRIPSLVALAVAVVILVVGLGSAGVYLLTRQPGVLSPPGTIDTFAGTGNSAVTADGINAMAADIVPTGLTFDRSGQLYFVDGQRVRLIDRSHVVHTVAGTGDSGYSGDGGAPLLAKLKVDAAPRGLSGVVVDSQGAIYFSDVYNNRVRRLMTGSTIETVAGTGEAGWSGDGGPAQLARLSQPAGLALDARGALYIADSGNNRIRKLDSSGNITTVAGSGRAGYSGDGGPAAGADLNAPQAVAYDEASGSIFVADTGNHRVRRIGPDGAIATFAGTGQPAFGGDGGKATAAQLSVPTALAIDGRGDLFIADNANQRVRRVDARGIISTFAGNGSEDIGSPLGDGGPATSASLLTPLALAVDSRSNLYIADPAGARIRRVLGG